MWEIYLNTNVFRSRYRIILLFLIFFYINLPPSRILDFQRVFFCCCYSCSWLFIWYNVYDLKWSTIRCSANESMDSKDVGQKNPSLPLSSYLTNKLNSMYLLYKKILLRRTNNKPTINFWISIKKKQETYAEGIC